MNIIKNKHNQAIEMALELIGETPTGAFLIKRKNEQNAKIFFDENLEKGALGKTSFNIYQKNTPPDIRLSKDLFPSQEEEFTMAMKPKTSDEKLGKMICVLTHELAHLAIGKENDFSEVIKKHKPSDVLSLMKIDEANAYAKTSRIAWELNETLGVDLALNELTGKAKYQFGDQEFNSKIDKATVSFLAELEKSKNPDKAEKASFMERFCSKDDSQLYNDMYISTYEDVFSDKDFFEKLKKIKPDEKKQWLKEKNADFIIKTSPVKDELLNKFGNYLNDDKQSKKYLLSQEYQKKGLDKKYFLRIKRLDEKLKIIQKPNQINITSIKSTQRA